MVNKITSVLETACVINRLKNVRKTAIYSFDWNLLWQERGKQCEGNGA